MKHAQKSNFHYCLLVAYDALTVSMKTPVQHMGLFEDAYVKFNGM